MNNKKSKLISTLLTIVLLSSLHEGILALETINKTANTQKSVFTVYVTESGNDHNDGLSLSTAVASINKAYSIIKTALLYQNRDAEILITPGTYTNQYVNMNWYMPHHNITIKPYNDNQPKPLITSTSTWRMVAFKITTRAQGDRTNFIFKNLRFKNMYGAITFYGDREADKASSSYNIIDGCEFDNTGMTAFSTIGLINSSHNQFHNNTFINQQRYTNKSTDGLLHAIYIAHNSTNNIIKNNYFENCDGDPIRIRDMSHNNLIEGNIFDHCGKKAPVSEWFCNADFLDYCTKTSAECPSYNNLVQNNQVSLQGWIVNQKYFNTYQGTPAQEVRGCTKNNHAFRIIDKNNTRF